MVSAKRVETRQQLYHLLKKDSETEISKKGASGLLKQFTDKFKTSLGPKAESLIGQENEEIGEERQRLREAEKQLQEAEKLSSEREKAAQEVQNLRTKLDQTQAKIDNNYGVIT